MRRLFAFPGSVSSVATNVTPVALPFQVGVLSVWPLLVLAKMHMQSPVVCV